MVRTQIQLTPLQAEGLKRLAAERGASMSEIVRESVDAYLQASRRTPDRELRRRAAAMAGVLKGGPPDLAERHDDYLAQANEQ